MRTEPPPGPGYPKARAVALTLAWLKSGLLFLLVIAMALLGGEHDLGGQAYLLGGVVSGSLYWLAVILPALLALRRDTGRRVAFSFALLVGPALLLAAWLA